MKNIFVVLLIIFNVKVVFANNYTQAESQLKQLDSKITNVKTNINTQKAKSTVLKKSLSSINKKISTYELKIKKINNNIESLERENNKIVDEIVALELKKSEQAKLLAQHIKTEYALKKLRATIVAPTKNKKNNMHLLQYYRALLKTRANIMQALKITENTLKQKKLIFIHQEETLLQDKKLLQADKVKLISLQAQQANNIKKIQADLNSQEQILNSYKKDRENLSKLLMSLVHKSTVSSASAVKFLQKKLPKPIQDPILGTIKVSQGVIFIAPKNNNVYAIYPGKIVFSDWFNGYGKLIIIDHGRGFMTLYGNNNTLLKSVGTYVKTGDKIAKVGNTSEFKKNGLYFEIRQQGRAIPPYKWLS